MAGVTAERKRYIDVLRCFGAIGVIFIHVSANNWYGFIGSADWTAFTVYEGLFKLAVPLFFMISGALFLNSEREGGIRRLFAHSVLRMVIFLLFWAAVYKLVQLPENGESLPKKLLDAAKQILKGETQTHLWFVYAIIGLYILVPVLKPLVQKTQRQTLLYAVVLCFVLGSLVEALSHIDHTEIFVNNIWKVRAGYAVGYVGYFLLGAYLDRYGASKRSAVCLYILGCAGQIATIAGTIWDCNSSGALNERVWSYTMPNVFFAAAAVFLLARTHEPREGKAYTCISFIARHALGIYGVHFLFILLFWKLDFTTFSFCGALSVPVISAGVFAASLAAAILLRRIPVLGRYIA